MINPTIWRRQYRAESAQERNWDLVTRGVRDLLNRIPETYDGILLDSTTDPAGDLAVAMSIKPKDRRQFHAAIAFLLGNGFIVHEGGVLRIPTFRRDQTGLSAPDELEQIEPRAPVRNPDLSEVRRQAGRKGGLVAQAKRGFASSKTTEQTTKQTEQLASSNLLQASASARDPEDQIREEENREDRSEKPVISKTLQVVGRARGERPIIKSALHENHDPRTWEPPASFGEYALELGLSERDWLDTLADFREKVRQPRGEVWLGNTLCRFIEQRAARRAEKVGVVPAKDPHPDDVWVFDFWRTIFRKHDALLDQKRAERFAALRVAGMSRADAEAAVRGAADDPWVNGKQDGVVRDNLGMIFGDRERYERFRDAGRLIMARRAGPELARAPVKTLEEQGFVPPPPGLLEQLGLRPDATARDAVAAIVAGAAPAVVK